MTVDEFVTKITQQAAKLTPEQRSREVIIYTDYGVDSVNGILIPGFTSPKHKEDFIDEDLIGTSGIPVEEASPAVLLV